MSTRFNHLDWLELGCRLLTKIDPHNLTVEALCRNAQKTKGSFYHHFEDFEQYIRELMEFWRGKYTRRIIEDVERYSSENRTNRLDEKAMEIDRKLEVAIRVYAQSNKIARRVLDQVDRERIGYIAQLYQEKNRCTSNDAQILAELEYAAFVGTMILWPDASNKKLEELNRRFKGCVNRESKK